MCWPIAFSFTPLHRHLNFLTSWVIKYYLWWEIFWRSPHLTVHELVCISWITLVLFQVSTLGPPREKINLMPENSILRFSMETFSFGQNRTAENRTKNLLKWWKSGSWSRAAHRPNRTAELWPMQFISLLSQPALHCVGFLVRRLDYFFSKSTRRKDLNVKISFSTWNRRAGNRQGLACWRKIEWSDRKPSARS